MNFYDLVNTGTVKFFLYCLVYIGSRMGSYINLLMPPSFYILKNNVYGKKKVCDNIGSGSSGFDS